MKFVVSIFSVIVFSCSALAQANPARPKIGVTLSGGGAKGLAHIGILKAIDSAGLKVDYVTGTSMGAVIGSLYSIGYSADSLEKIARSIDWDLLLSNQSGLRSLFMEEKDEYSKYDIELPWVNNQFKISTGFLEGQELWLKFSELYFPVSNIKDFSQFNIPFRGIATDVGNGEAVVLKDGEIIAAIRSSIAIPSLFTASTHKGKLLVDGGISRNFPVRDVKEMGADYVIGSTVATGLLPPEKVKNIVQLLLQIAFFREAEDVKKEVPLCDVYIPFNLDKYSMANFNDAEEILEIGINEGRKMYPQFKHLADSLNEKYGIQPLDHQRLPVLKTVYIDSVRSTGFDNTTRAFFLNTMNLKLHKHYTAVEIANMVRQAFGTRYYNRINYSLEQRADSNYTIVFDVAENPLSFLKAGLHFNRFSGIGVIANITARNFLLPNSRSLATVNIGESFRIKGEHLQYLGRRKDFGFTLKAQLDRFDVTTYDLYKRTGLYKQNFAEVSEKLHFSPGKSFTIGIGHRFEWINYNPRISSSFEFKGKNNFSTVFSYLKHNTLDRNIFPRRGIKLDAEFGRVLTQQVRINFLIDGEPPTNPDSLRTSGHPYWRTSFSAEGYLPLNHRFTAFANMQTGINFNYSRNIMNEFVIGGLTKIVRNQVLFAGLQEAVIYSPAVATFQGGLRTSLFTGAYLTGRANVLFNNFISRSDFFKYEDLYTGYALTFSYNFALGPLDVSVMYCDQTKKIQSYINLGIPF